MKTPISRTKGIRLSRPPWDRMMRVHEWIESGRLPNCVSMAEHTQTAEPTRARSVEAAALERGVADLVSQAYGLALEENALVWQTAPPLMPITPPLS